MPVEYAWAEDVRKIADEEVIPKWHRHLLSVGIAYLFADELPEKNGKAVLAKIKRANPLEHFLTDRDLVMIVDRLAWQTSLTTGQRVALVDHELCHFTLDEGKLVSTTHDIEEFSAIVRAARRLEKGRVRFPVEGQTCPTRLVPAGSHRGQEAKWEDDGRWNMNDLTPLPGGVDPSTGEVKDE